jgi:hypothetical protein
LEHEKTATIQTSQPQENRPTTERNDGGCDRRVRPCPGRWIARRKGKGALNMKRISVSSDGILEVGYHQDTETIGTLELKFSNGGVYEFFNVPSTMYDEFMHAPSREDYYFTNIGKRFPCMRVG